MAFTYFFRDKQTLDFIVEHMIPLVTGRSRIKIWDAGCASGEEPYTFAILLAEKMGKYIFKNVEIHATDLDISNQFGEIIKNGTYPYNQLQRIPEDLFLKYFSKIEGTDDQYKISEDLTAKMRYKRESLLSLVPTSTEFSLVICKNVLLHQSYEQRVQILEMFHRSLTDEGLLAMEQTQKLPDELAGKFKPLVSNAQLYRKITLQN
jgi:chemotaxis protein methyltransferase CheR